MIPNVGLALWSWTNTITFEVVEKEISDFEVTEKVKNAAFFQGVIEPLNPRDLRILPENQRRWNHWTLWTTYPLKVDQVVRDPQGIEYRVMTSQNWGDSGHFQYTLSEEPNVPEIGMAE
jgi:hypothetical protein